MEQFDSIYFRGQGPALLAVRDANGNPQGFSFAGDIDSIEGSPSTTRHDVIENVSGQRLTAASFITQQTFPIIINFKSAKPAHLAVALQADLTVQASGSVTDQAQTGYHDKFTRLEHVKVSSVVITDSTGITTYAAGTDYILHAEEGMIEVLSTGSITDGQSLLIDYSYAAQKTLKGNPGNKEYSLTFAGMNTANGDKSGRCTIHKLVIDPGFLSLIQGDTEGALSVNAQMLVDSERAAGDQLYTWNYED